MTNIFSYFEKESIGSVNFNGKIINMILPTKVFINFHSQVFNTFSRIWSFTTLFYFKSLLNFFCLDLKITISVFFTLSEILFAFNQLTRRFKSALTSLFSFLIDLPRHNRLVSSVKWWTLQNVIAWFRLFIYNKNSSGPPQGTTQFIAARPESYPFIGTYWQIDRI